MALWQEGDILISFRGPSAGTPPQDSRIGVWSSDGGTFRGAVYEAPPLTQTDEALQNLAYFNSNVYGRIKSSSPDALWVADGEQNSAIPLFYIVNFGGGGIGVDDNGYIYLGTISDDGLNTSQITKLNSDGSINTIFSYDPASPAVEDGGDANCVHVNRAGTRAYFSRCMSNWGSFSTFISINRLDLETGGQLPYLDFNQSTNKLTTPTRLQHFVVGSDDNIYMVYRSSSGKYYVAISDPDGLILENWEIVGSQDSEGLAVNCDSTVILVHLNISGGSVVENSIFIGYDRQGNPLFTLHPYPDIDIDSQEEGVVFANNRGNCPPVPGAGVFFMNVTVIGAN